MNIQDLNVPKGIRFMSQWEDFKLPDHPNILDKQIPGCGFTTWILTNNENVILCSPRKVLLENKKDQLGDSVFLVRNFYTELGVDRDLSSKKVLKVNIDRIREERRKAAEASKKTYEKMEFELIDHWFQCRIKNVPCKIMVTYDSYQRVKGTLKHLGVFGDFYTIVDEFQSIFVDSRFKADTELKFVNCLQDVSKVCYVSATPMIESYLDRLDEFRDLPYVRLDWKTEDPGRVLEPVIDYYRLKSVRSVGSKIISDYRKGKFEKSAVVVDGEPRIVESREAVIYVNSVNNIINLIDWNSLSPEEVNILCADTEDNQKRINSRLGKSFRIGHVPTSGEPRKMFTFCTRTVYLGADFYSDNARTFILSDANIDSMAVDITLDLPQILGRQRLDINPWKNKATLYARTIAGKNEVDLKEFENLIARKIAKTESLLRSYGNANQEDRWNLAETYQIMAESTKYSKNYVAVNDHSDREGEGKSLIPTMNHLALVSEQRAYDIQQIDYKDRCTVFRILTDVLGTKINKDEVSDFMMQYEMADSSYSKMKLLCESELSPADLESVLNQVAEYHKRFYIFLGPERCRALGYGYAQMKRECDIKSFNTVELDTAVYNSFPEGSVISKVDAKSTLSEIYSDINYQKVAKANDIEQWFEVKRARIPKDGKYIEGYKLLKRKK